MLIKYKQRNLGDKYDYDRWIHRTTPPSQNALLEASAAMLRVGFTNLR